eukprot:Skav217647  [mRNA]  locus=scaffold41:144221:145060:+ [translate_table: standard]
MAQVHKQIAASQHFLNGLRSLPHFNELCGKQLTRLVSLIERQSLSLAEAASCVESLRDDLWDGASLSQLKAALAANTTHEEPGSVVRVVQQDYTALPHYLEQSMWNCLEQLADEQSKLELLCRLAASLGLKNPTEGSCGCIIYLALFLPLNHGLLETQKYDKLQKKKPLIKKLLKSFATSVSGVETLPSLPAECAQHLIGQCISEGVYSWHANWLIHDRDSSKHQRLSFEEHAHVCARRRTSCGQKHSSCRSKCVISGRCCCCWRGCGQASHGRRAEAQ